MKQYQELLRHILDQGEYRADRTGTGTLSIFGYQMRIDLNEGFPLLTTKRVHFKSVVYELLWFLSGRTDIKFMVDNNVNIWNPDAHRWYKSTTKTDISYKDFVTELRNGSLNVDLGPIYGKQWRKWSDTSSDYTDQIKSVIESIKTDPTSRRHVVSAWNVSKLGEMALPPCHVMFQFYVSNDNKLSCHLYQRSADVFLGSPFNIASYSLLVHMIANELNLKVGEFIYTLGDAHLYKNHIEQAQLQISRSPKQLPKLEISPNKSVLDIEASDIKLIDYNPDSPIKGAVSVGV
ncbi:thymidylate synthase [Listeria phage LIS04]|nr:thymidylate synthase [Listeria phage LIS04]